MSNLPLFDIAIIIIYLLAMVAVGFYFSKRNKNSTQFTSASGRIPGWAIGLSIYATFLSSNTFLGVPGKQGLCGSSSPPLEERLGEAV